jgi:DNA (cytosine-5)-methyltransferase 1
MIPATSRPTAVDLFAGCGGLSVGVRRAGFRVVAAIESDHRSAATYALNHSDVVVVDRDIRLVDPLSVLTEVGVGVGELDLLAGCPPCQGFSRLGRSRGVAKDPRNELIWEILRFVEAVRPKGVMIENVVGLLRYSKFGKFCVRLEKLGYRYRAEVLDASDFGIPQRRKRLVVLATRREFAMPSSAKPCRQRRSVRDAIGSIASPRDSADELHRMSVVHSHRIRSLIRAVEVDGGGRAALPERLRLQCHRNFDGFSDVYGRMRWDDVAPTITAGCFNPSKGRFIHPGQHRAITLREAALLQGFPRNYQFDVAQGKEHIGLMIGNALPPAFARAQARAVRLAIEGCAKPSS